MKLFGTPMIWKSSRQATVTTSSTEAELLALAHTAKELYYVRRFFKQIGLTLDSEYAIEEDNKQTFRLVTNDTLRLETRLRHVDIHNMWLRQEVQAGRLLIVWVETTAMIADGLTKALQGQKFESFGASMGVVPVPMLPSAEPRNCLNTVLVCGSGELLRSDGKRQWYKAIE